MTARKGSDLARPSRFAGRGKRDANHKAIQEVFEQHGWHVQDLSSVGGGCPDMLVLDPGPAMDGLVLIEIKMPKGKTRDKQVAFAKVWPVVVLRSVDAALAYVRDAR